MSESATLKAGAITFVPNDRIDDSAKLRVEIKDDANNTLGIVDLAADGLTSDEDQETVALFAFNVDNARRKARYMIQYEDREQVLQEVDEDLREWSFRQRRGHERWEGLGDKAVLNAKLQR